MSQKNLTYKHNFNYPVNQVYNLIEEEQLKFFQHYDSKIETFVKGIKIKKQMLTKTAKKSVDVTMCVKDVVKNKKIEVLSGGEKVRLALCEVIFSNANFLTLAMAKIRRHLF